MYQILMAAQSSGSVSINQPNPLTEISNSTDVSCNGGSDGTAEIISIAGGTLPYSTNWFGSRHYSFICWKLFLSNSRF